MKRYRPWLLCALASGSIAAAAPVMAQAVRSSPAASPSAPADMTVPDDLGAPLEGPATPSPPVGRTLSVDSPIGVIAASAEGRAVLERNLPGLLERPEYMMFKGMSVAKLASMSNGRISAAKVEHMRAELVTLRVAEATPTRSHSIFTRSGQAVGRATKAVYTRGGAAVQRATQAVYHRVALMIASL